MAWLPVYEACGNSAVASKFHRYTTSRLIEGMTQVYMQCLSVIYNRPSYPFHRYIGSSYLSIHLFISLRVYTYIYISLYTCSYTFWNAALLAAHEEWPRHYDPRTSQCRSWGKLVDDGCDVEPTTTSVALWLHSLWSIILLFLH